MSAEAMRIVREALETTSTGHAYKPHTEALAALDSLEAHVAELKEDRGKLWRLVGEERERIAEIKCKRDKLDTAYTRECAALQAAERRAKELEYQRDVWREATKEQRLRAEVLEADLT